MGSRRFSRWRIAGLLTIGWCNFAVAAPARLCVVSETALLKSEARAMAALGKTLEKKLPGIVTSDATEDEKAATKQLASGAALTALPAAWQGAPLVIVMTVLPAVGKEPQRRSAGVGAIAIVKPPATEPLYRETIVGDAELSLQGTKLPQWLVKMIDLIGKAAP